MKHNLLRAAAVAATMSLAVAANAQVIVGGGDAPASVNSGSLNSVAANSKSDGDSKPESCLYFDWRFPKHYKDVKGFDFSLGVASEWYFASMEFAKSGFEGSKLAWAIDLGLHKRFYVAGDFWFAPLFGIGVTFYDEQTNFNIMLEPRVGYNLSDKVSLHLGYRFLKSCGKGTADFGDCGGVSLGIGYNW